MIRYENGYLKIHPDTIEVVRKEINLDQPGRVEEAVDLLNQWIQKQDHFIRKEFPRNYLESTLISVKGSTERAKQKIDKLCTLKTLMPDCFPANYTKETFIRLQDFLCQAVLPKLSKNHQRVYVWSIKSESQHLIDSSIQQMFTKMAMVMCEYIKMSDYHSGVVAVLDYRGINMLNYLSRINLMYLKNCATLVTEGYSFRVKSIHILSDSKTIDALVTLIKQYLSTKLGERILLHKNLESLHEVIDKDILPEDYGGKEKPLKDLCDELLNTLCSGKVLEFIQEMFEAKTDESRRTGQVFNEQYIGMPGSFRSLTVD